MERLIDIALRAARRTQSTVCAGGRIAVGTLPALPEGWIDRDHREMLSELDRLLPVWCEAFQQDLGAAMAFRRRTSIEKCHQWLEAIQADLRAQKGTT